MYHFLQVDNWIAQLAQLFTPSFPITFAIVTWCNNESSKGSSNGATFTKLIGVCATWSLLQTLKRDYYNYNYIEAVGRITSFRFTVRTMRAATTMSHCCLVRSRRVVKIPIITRVTRSCTLLPQRVIIKASLTKTC